MDSQSIYRMFYIADIYRLRLFNDITSSTSIKSINDNTTASVTKSTSSNNLTTTSKYKFIYGPKDTEVSRIRILGIVVSINTSALEIILDDSTELIICVLKNKLLLPKLGDLVDLFGILTYNTNTSKPFINTEVLTCKSPLSEPVRYLEMIKLYKTTYFPPYPSVYSKQSITPSYNQISLLITFESIIGCIKSLSKPCFKDIESYFIKKNAKNIKDLRDLLDNMIMECYLFEDNEIFVLI